jgi:hypothetical protein
VASFPARWVDGKRGIALILGLTVLLLAYYLRTERQITGGVVSAPLDDAWIHYQFARNLSQGNGFSYVSGQPTPGSTAPLWTLLLAGVGLLTQDFVAPSLALSAGFLLLTIWLTYRLTADLTGDTLTALLAALGMGLTGRMLWAGLSAMEVTLFTALSLAAVWAYHQHGLGLLTALLFALASQARPEGHALFALAVANSLLSLRWPERDATPRLTWRTLAGALFVYGLVSLPYALFSLSVTGRPLPNTFYAKARSAQLFSFRTLGETLSLHWQDNVVAFLLIPFGLLPLWRRSRLVVGWLIGLTLLTPFIIPFVWHHGRYTLPLIPFQMISAAAGLTWLVGKLPAYGRPATALLAAALILGGAWRLPYWAGMLGHNSREILTIDVALGHWLAANTAPDDLIAVDDIGATIFISQRPIIDLNGLVSPAMWPVLDDPDLTSAAIRLLAAAGVNYLAVFPNWHTPLVSDTNMAVPIQRFTVDTQSVIGGTEAVVYEMNWPYRRQVAPQYERPVSLGDAIQLLGYDFNPPATTEEPLRLTLYWQAVTAVLADYKVFIHVLNEAGELIAQTDGQPVGGLAPTYRWQAGDLIRDPYAISLPPDLPPGTYQIRTGLYAPDTLLRLPANGENVQDNSILLTTFGRQ